MSDLKEFDSGNKPTKPPLTLEELRKHAELIRAFKETANAISADLKHRRDSNHG
jgi:hypothetical protein